MDNKVFNLSKTSMVKEASPKRIRDRGINWKEHYQEKSQALKKRFDKDIGQGVYYRWEGHDYTTSSDYFVVVGPATQRYGQKSFFAGIKKLPPKERRKKVYAPSGKYFTNIVSALSYASRMWGVKFPPNQKNYSTQDLQNIRIPRHVKG